MCSSSLYDIADSGFFTFNIYSSIYYYQIWMDEWMNGCSLWFIAYTLHASLGYKYGSYYIIIQLNTFAQSRFSKMFPSHKCIIFALDCFLSAQYDQRLKFLYKKFIHMWLTYLANDSIGPLGSSDDPIGRLVRLRASGWSATAIEAAPSTTTNKYLCTLSIINERMFERVSCCYVQVNNCNIHNRGNGDHFLFFPSSPSPSSSSSSSSTSQ